MRIRRSDRPDVCDYDTHVTAQRPVCELPCKQCNMRSICIQVDYPRLHGTRVKAIRVCCIPLLYSHTHPLLSTLRDGACWCVGGPNCSLETGNPFCDARFAIRASLRVSSWRVCEASGKKKNSCTRRASSSSASNSRGRPVRSRTRGRSPGA